MKYPTLQDVPLGQLRKWLSAAERSFGSTCPTAKVYRTEIRRRIELERRKQWRSRKAVRDAR